MSMYNKRFFSILIIRTILNVSSYRFIGCYRKCKEKRAGSKGGTKKGETKGGRRTTEKGSW